MAHERFKSIMLPSEIILEITIEKKMQNFFSS